MRYKDCTEEDILWLKSRIPCFNRSLNLGDEKWKDVSVITAWNCHKDQINIMNAARFAQDTGQTLHTFYSVDKQSAPRRQQPTPRRGPKIRLPAKNENHKVLWRQPPHTSEHIASALSLCIGMPVMIRNNEATELGVTKGQEAIVKGWTSREIPKYPGKFALDVLFVELVKPAVPVKLPHLERNVVPLTKISNTIKAFLPNDSAVNLTRQQVPVLPNFAMTDYCSQGKTRPVNVVDLKRSKNHQAIYVALSRGISAEDTIILRDFSTKKITGGVSGFLREELRSKRKREGDGDENSEKRPKIDQEIRSEQIAQRELIKGPMGRGGWSASWKWDSTNWSCAYDSYLTIIRFIWHTYHETVSLGDLAEYSWYMNYLFNTFDDIKSGELTLDDCRLGLMGTDICSLVQVVNGLVLNDNSNYSSRLCRGCGTAIQGLHFEAVGRYTVMRTPLLTVMSIQEYLHGLISSPADHCPHCNGDLIIQHDFAQLMCVQLPNSSYDIIRDRLVIDRKLDVGGLIYRLVGVVYWSAEDAHFSTRLVDGGGRVYQYDGMQADGCVRYEFSIKNEVHLAGLSTKEHKVASIAVYMRLN
ncbi:hypothetical protein NMY22_g14242 [Coprinellus aureogranulatus]|nr:hypothetical protein NMY22_g14242 [Coprinellus aureogranulatus]